MFEIIPMLLVNEACHWCAPQECFTASLWWGDCLICFYTKDETRLAANKLNDLACDILKHVTKCIEPDSDYVIDPDKLAAAIGQCKILPCCWDDFRPAVMFGYGTRVCIPVDAVVGGEREVGR